MGMTDGLRVENEHSNEHSDGASVAQAALASTPDIVVELTDMSDLAGAGRIFMGGLMIELESNHDALLVANDCMAKFERLEGRLLEIIDQL